MSIPDEAVEAAARRMLGAVTMRDIMAILSAAAPFIAAQALRGASDAYPLETAYGGAEHAVLWLKERAENMNGSGT